MFSCTFCWHPYHLITFHSPDDVIINGVKYSSLSWQIVYIPLSLWINCWTRWLCLLVRLSQGLFNPPIRIPSMRIMMSWGKLCIILFIHTTKLLWLSGRSSVDRQRLQRRSLYLIQHFAECCLIVILSTAAIASVSLWIARIPWAPFINVGYFNSDMTEKLCPLQNAGWNCFHWELVSNSIAIFTRQFTFYSYWYQN